MSSPTAIRAIGQLVITPRALADYRDMFMLSDEEILAGPVLDCPGGASPLGAQVRARGGTVVSVDPAYGPPADVLMPQVREDVERTADWVGSQTETIHWPYVGNAEALRRMWELAVDMFAADYAPDGERYVSARLPELPFADRHFALSLCSHLLFCYPEYLDYDAHLAGLLELVRVTSGEARVYPVVDTTATEYPRMADLQAGLAEQGIRSELRPARATWLRGGDRYLACWRV